jgi:hypothetical protein
MSLIISLNGYGQEYFDRGKINYLNKELIYYGLPIYQEISINLPDNDRLPNLSWKWRHLHQLQFIAIQIASNPTWKPKEYLSSQKSSKGCYQKFYDDNKSHLICCGRYYTGNFIPVKFDNNIVLGDPFLYACGSSINLRHELKIIAYRIGFNLDKYDPNLEPQVDDFLSSEKFLIFQLYEMTNASIKYNLIIDFS